MHHLFTCLGRKDKWQKNASLPNSASQFPPKGECEKEENVEAIDTPTCCHFGVCSGDVSRLNSTTQSNNEDMSTCKDAITGRPAFKSTIHSAGPDHGSASPMNKRADPLERSNSVFTTLSKSCQFRVRSPPPPYIPYNTESKQTQNDLCRMNYRPQAVPIVLPNDPASKERREAALRGRGLLPSRQPRGLSATDVDPDRPIGLRKYDGSFSGPDNGHSDANEIARSWRTRNLIWLSEQSDSPGNSITEDASPNGVAMQDQLAPFPLCLLSTPSDTFLACPTTPTLLQSVCYSSSETEDSWDTTEDDHNGSSVSSAVKNGEGLLCQEIIADGSEPRSDDDDTDPFRSLPSPFLLTATGDGRDTVPRHTPVALLGGLKSRGSTLTSTPPPALSKSTSMVSLRRTMPSYSSGRTRTHSTMSSAMPRPPPLPLNVKISDDLDLRAEVPGTMKLVGCTRSRF